MRRKGTPCACECDPCKGKNSVRAINNVSPDPNGDFEIKAGNGIGISQSGDNSITIINQAMASSFVAGNNIDITPVGDDLQISVTNDVSINNLNVAGDIIQQGAAYETHAEKIYTTNDYIYMRDGAVGGLAVGAFSGFQVEKYDGTNDGRLVIDNSGVARVGDVGDEQPLLTRSESAQLNNGDLLQWNGTSQKAVSSGVNTSQIVRGTGNIGSDTKPIKVVGGVATPVNDELTIRPIAMQIAKTGGTLNVTGVWTNLPLTGASTSGDTSDFTIGTDSIIMKRKGIAVITYHLAGTMNANGDMYTRILPAGAQTVNNVASANSSNDISCIVPVNVGSVISFQYYMSGATSFTILTYNNGFYASIMVI